MSERLKVHSRVRVVAVTVRVGDHPTMRHCLLRRLGMSGTVVGWDPRFTLPCRVKFDDGDVAFIAKENLEVLEATEPRNIGGWSDRMQQLTEAIGRHPAAESDPSVIDAVNAVEDALRQKEVG